MNTTRSSPSRTITARLGGAAWTQSNFHGLELYGELLNVFDSRAHDIDYYYATRFPGEPAEGIEGPVSRVVEPQQFRVGVKKRF